MTASGGRPRRSSDLTAPLRPLADLGDKVHVHAGRSLRTRMLVSLRQADNGRPEPAPYRWRKVPGWSPADVIIPPRDTAASVRAEQQEWAREHAELVAAVRARLGPEATE